MIKKTNGDPISPEDFKFLLMLKQAISESSPDPDIIAADPRIMPTSLAMLENTFHTNPYTRAKKTGYCDMNGKEIKYPWWKAFRCWIGWHKRTDFTKGRQLLTCAWCYKVGTDTQRSIDKDL